MGDVTNDRVYIGRIGDCLWDVKPCDCGHKTIIVASVEKHTLELGDVVEGEATQRVSGECPNCHAGLIITESD